MHNFVRMHMLHMYTAVHLHWHAYDDGHTNLPHAFKTDCRNTPYRYLLNLMDQLSSLQYYSKNSTIRKLLHKTNSGYNSNDRVVEVIYIYKQVFHCSWCKNTPIYERLWTQNLTTLRWRPPVDNCCNSSRPIMVLKNLQSYSKRIPLKIGGNTSVLRHAGCMLVSRDAYRQMIHDIYISTAW